MSETVEAVNRERALALLSGGVTIPITNFLGDDGDEYESEDAVVAVAGPSPEGLWYRIILSHFKAVTIN